MQKPLLPNRAEKDFLGDEIVGLASFAEQQTDDDFGYRQEGDEAEDLTAEEEDDEFHAAMSASEELQLFVGPSRKSSDNVDTNDQRVNNGNISDSALLEGRRHKNKVNQRRHKRHARFLHSIRYEDNGALKRSRRLYGVCVSRYIDGDKLANTIKLKHGRYRRWKKIIYEGDFVHLYTQTVEKKLGGLEPKVNGRQDSSFRRKGITKYTSGNARKILVSGKEVARNEDVTHEEVSPTYRKEREQHVFIFPFGCIVMWNLSERDEEQIVQISLKSDSNESLQEILREEDDMTYSYDHISSQRSTKVENDKISLMTQELGEKMAISLAFAQSVKLILHEETIDSKIDLYKKYPEILSRTGKIDLSQIDIAKKIGELFIIRNTVNLYSDMLDTPDVFWEEDKFEPTYKKLRKYLDIDKRIEVMNQRMEIIRELLELLSTQQDQSHANRLEFIIMVLIVIEVVIEVVWNIVLKDILGLFPLKGNSSGNDDPFRL